MGQGADDRGQMTEGFEFGIGNAECGKKMKSEFGSQELKHRVELTDVRGKRTEKNYHGKTRKFTEELNPKNCLILSSGGTKRSERK
jgi:hypothetical protein